MNLLLKRIQTWGFSGILMLQFLCCAGNAATSSSDAIVLSELLDSGSSTERAVNSYSFNGVSWHSTDQTIFNNWGTLNGNTDRVDLFFAGNRFLRINRGRSPVVGQSLQPATIEISSNLIDWTLVYRFPTGIHSLQRPLVCTNFRKRNTLGTLSRCHSV